MFQDSMTFGENVSNGSTPVLIPATISIQGISTTDLERETLVTPLPPPEPPPNTKKKRTLAFLLLGLSVGAILATVFGYRYWQYTSTHETTDNATVAGSIHQVSSKIEGTVSNVLVSDNQVVKPGQILVQLDRQDYENKVQQAQAALESAKRQANAAQANIALASETTSGKTTVAQGDIGTAQAAIGTASAIVQEAEAGIPLAQSLVAQAEATRQKAQADYTRYDTLYQQGAIARQQLDTAQAAYTVAEAQKASALQGVQQAQAKLAQAQEGITSAQAKLAASRGGLQQATASGQQTLVNRSQYAAAQGAIAEAEVSLKAAQLQLSYINITASSNGRIGKKNVEIGNRIQVGAPLMAIVDTNYWVIANFKETQLNKIKSGQPVEVKFDAFPGRIFRGQVDSISPASGSQFTLLPPDNATGNFTKIVQRIPVKVSLDPETLKGYESRVTPGLSAEVTVGIQ